MISGKVQWKKKPKLTVDQKVLRKCVTEVGRVVTKAVKASARAFKVSGDLVKSIAMKLWTKNEKVAAIIGTRNRFGLPYPTARKEALHIPNKYVGRAENKYHFLSENLSNDTINQLRTMVKSTRDLISGT